MASLSSRRSVVTFLATLPFGLALIPRRVTASALPDVEPQPHMRAALASLRAAKEHLEKATPDKGGHRASAIVHVDQAIKETEAGIQFDNRH